MTISNAPDLATPDSKLTYLQLYGQHIWQPLDTRVATSLLCRLAAVTTILALVRVDIFLIQAFVQRQSGQWFAVLLLALLDQVLKTKTQIKE